MAKFTLGCKITESGCINRDKNSVLNMNNIINGLISTGKRLSRFCRNKTTKPHYLNKEEKLVRSQHGAYWSKN